MKIDANPGRHPIAATSQPVVRRESTPTTETTMSFERIQALEQTLKETPLVRPEKVAQAKALAADSNYPSDKVLNRLADVFAKHITR